MDALVSLVDQVIPGSPVLAITTAVVLLAAGYIARRVARSMQRQGARVGTLEKLARLERSRRRQVEQCLREEGIPLPYWPEDPPELYLAGTRRPARDVDDDQDDEHQVPDLDTAHMDTQYFIPPRPTPRRTS